MEDLVNTFNTISRVEMTLPNKFMTDIGVKEQLMISGLVFGLL